MSVDAESVPTVGIENATQTPEPESQACVDAANALPTTHQQLKQFSEGFSGGKVTQGTKQYNRRRPHLECGNTCSSNQKSVVMRIYKFPNLSAHGGQVLDCRAAL